MSYLSDVAELECNESLDKVTLLIPPHPKFSTSSQVRLRDPVIDYPRTVRCACNR